MKDDDIVKGARQVAAFLTGPGGDLISLDIAVARHLAWFAAARDRGIRWRGIAALLTQAGARRPDGGGLTAALLSAVYSRQNSKRAAAEGRSDKSSDRTKLTTARRQLLAPPPTVSPAIEHEEAAPPIGGQPEITGRRPAFEQRSGQGRPFSTPAGADDNLDRIRERMQRAAVVRRQREG